jgi:hypothetical protein
MTVREGVGQPTEHHVYTSPEIEGICGATISIAASPDNEELPLTSRQCRVSITVNGRSTAIRLGLEAVLVLMHSFGECFSLHPSEIVLGRREGEKVKL